MTSAGFATGVYVDGAKGSFFDVRVIPFSALYSLSEND
jgi:hypothetical protein